jgi:hypothetical protein
MFDSPQFDQSPAELITMAAYLDAISWHLAMAAWNLRAAAGADAPLPQRQHPPQFLETANPEGCA